MTFEYTIIEDAWTAKNREIADLRAENERLHRGLNLYERELEDQIAKRTYWQDEAMKLRASNERLRAALTETQRIVYGRGE